MNVTFLFVLLIKIMSLVVLKIFLFVHIDIHHSEHPLFVKLWSYHSSYHYELHLSAMLLYHLTFYNDEQIQNMFDEMKNQHVLLLHFQVNLNILLDGWHVLKREGEIRGRDRRRSEGDRERSEERGRPEVGGVEMKGRREKRKEKKKRKRVSMKKKLIYVRFDWIYIWWYYSRKISKNKII